MPKTIHIRGAGAVLAGGILSGAPALNQAKSLLSPGPDGDQLEEFDPKPYISTVKGYLDGAGKLALAAASMAVDAHRTKLTERGATVGVVSGSRWGASESGFRFLRQLVEKGPHFASPMVFPHSYANTAGNLVAMEFRFAGPHMVYLAPNAATEVLQCAAAILDGGQASDMIALVYEAAPPRTLPDPCTPIHGAVALWLTTAPHDAIGTLNAALDEARPARAPAAAGAVADLAPLLPNCAHPQRPS